MSYFAGIDGGQSTTTAAIGDGHGRILARGVAGPADEIGASADSTRLRDALRAALDDALRQAALPKDTSFTAIVAGVSGYEGRVYGKAPHLPARRVVLAHDAPVAHAGALAGEPGVVAIAGTGSVVYACDRNGHGRTYGGWGYLFGDEGSAFWLAREALAALMRCEDDGNASLDDEAKAARAFFGVPSLRALARAFYSGSIPRERLAAFAPEALRFERARAIADGGAERLARVAAGAIAAGVPSTVALVGGMFADRRFRQRAVAAIDRAVSGAHVVEPRYDPAAGALLLAYREAGFAPPELRG